MSAGHTPTPWVAHYREDGRGTTWSIGRAETGPHYTLARAYRPAGDGPDVTEANARFICRAVNAHDDLVEAMLRLDADARPSNWDDDDDPDQVKAWQSLDEALTKAGVK